MTIQYYRDLEQGTPEWIEARRGVLTASQVDLILTPTLKVAENEKKRAHVYEIAAQRISGFVEPNYVGDHMLRGKEDEIETRLLYGEHFAPVTEVGFITNDRWGFKIGYSPDGLVADDGLIECKSRLQKYQIETIAANAVPEKYMLQIQTALLVSERKWLDFLSFSGGLPLFRLRVLPDPAAHEAILKAAALFEAKVQETIEAYHARLADGQKWVATERRIDQEMFV